MNQPRMPMDSITLLIVCPLVFLSGLVDSIAGGGGLISLPAYLIAGLPAHQALGTNKLSSAIGTAVATFRLARNGYVRARLALPAVVGALAGSAIGAKLALFTPEGIFQILLIGALPVVAVALMRKPDLQPDASKVISPAKQLAIVGAISLSIGCYDGFYGPGTGTFMLLAFVAFANLDVRVAAGEKQCANLASNVAALMMFLSAGVVNIQLGLIAAVFGMAGNYIGSGLVMRDGSKVIRPLIIGVLVILFIKVVSDLL